MPRKGPKGTGVGRGGAGAVLPKKVRSSLRRKRGQLLRQHTRKRKSMYVQASLSLMILISINCKIFKVKRCTHAFVTAVDRF
jgi:hypothetical protein